MISLPDCLDTLYLVAISDRFPSMSNHPVKRAADLVGGYSALAKLLGVTKGAVHQWTDEGRQVPAEHCPAIERITDGLVTCEELNSEVDWAFVRGRALSDKPRSQSS